MFKYRPLTGSPPTRRCVICRRLEIPESGTLIRALWFCPACTMQIRREMMKEVSAHEKHPAAEDP